MVPMAKYITDKSCAILSRARDHLLSQLSILSNLLRLSFHKPVHTIEKWSAYSDGYSSSVASSLNTGEQSEADVIKAYTNSHLSPGFETAVEFEG